jgi:hypothetical protein
MWEAERLGGRQQVMQNNSWMPNQPNFDPSVRKSLKSTMSRKLYFVTKEMTLGWFKMIRGCPKGQMIQELNYSWVIFLVTKTQTQATSEESSKPLHQEITTLVNLWNLDPRSHLWSK